MQQNFQKMAKIDQNITKYGKKSKIGIKSPQIWPTICKFSVIFFAVSKIFAADTVRTFFMSGTINYMSDRSITCLSDKKPVLHLTTIIGEFVYLLAPGMESCWALFSSSV